METDAASVQTDCSSDEVIVEGLLLEDRGEGAEEIEHWCIVTNDYFHISSHKVFRLCLVCGAAFGTSGMT
jgi:hypothetical protein